MPADAPTQPGPQLSPENDATYAAIRAEIQFELNLVNARVNWLIASQAFLFVPLTMGTRGGTLRDSLFYPLIPALGVVICAMVLVSIMAAVWRSRQWRAKAEQGAYAGDDQHARFSRIAPRTPLIPVLGATGAVGVPMALALTWVWLLVNPLG